MRRFWSGFRRWCWTRARIFCSRLGSEFLRRLYGGECRAKSMNKRDPNPKRLPVILSAVILTLDALLFFRGSDTRLRPLILLLSLLVVAALWRYRLHFFV